MKVRAKSVPNGDVWLKKISFFVFADAERQESQRNHWGYGVETFFFSQWDFCGRGIGGAASLFSAVLQSQFVTMLFEVRQAIAVTWLANKKSDRPWRSIASHLFPASVLQRPSMEVR
jgi:hypothetical protein